MFGERQAHGCTHIKRALDTEELPYSNGVNFRPAQLAEERVEAKSLTAETTTFPNPLTFIFSEFRSYLKNGVHHLQLKREPNNLLSFFFFFSS